MLSFVRSGGIDWPGFIGLWAGENGYLWSSYTNKNTYTVFQAMLFAFGIADNASSAINSYWYGYPLRCLVR